MTGILLIATVILGVLLQDTRRRLKSLETRLSAGDLIVSPEPVTDAEAARFETGHESGPALEAEARQISPEPDLTDPVHDPVAEFVPIRVETAPPMRQEHAPDLEPGQPAIALPSWFGFEDLFGRKLPIWAGGMTLIVAAVLMVKYSVDSGLLSPTVRVVLGLLFSAALIGGGELARRRADFVRDVRVAQSLAGAGVGGLYAATLAAANLYGMIGPGLAFAGLAAITALALGLALRFGAPCAVLGLIGGLATPAVVQAESPSVPLLAGYLAVVIGAITLLSRRQRWVWLGLGALTGGAGWSLLTIATGGLDSGGTLSMGLLVLLIGLGLPMLVPESRGRPILRVGAAIVGAFQLALLVATGDFAPLTWGLYGLLSLAFVWLADRTPGLRKTAAVPMLTTLGLAAVWPAPGTGLFAAVMAGIVAIYGGHALWHLWRSDRALWEVGLLTAISLGGYAICCAKFYEGAPGQEPKFALLALAFGALPALGGALGWRRSERQGDARFALLSCCAGVLLALAGLVGLPEWAAPIVIGSTAGGLLALSLAACDDRLTKGALAFLGAAVAALAVYAEKGEMARLIAAVPVPELGHALLRWGALALVATAFAWRAPGTRLRYALQTLAVLLGYGLVAQVVPAPWLAVLVAATLMLFAEANGRRPRLQLGAGQGTLAVLLLLWAAAPLGYWLAAGTMSLVGDPVFVTDLPDAGTAMRQLAVPAGAAAFALWRRRESLPPSIRTVAAMIAGGLGVAGCHIVFKQVFAIGDQASFVRMGLAERSLWEALLIGAALATWRWPSVRTLSLALLAAGSAHALFYSVVLHDPLWSEQAVGPWPLINLLLSAFGIVFAAPSLLARIAPDLARAWQRPGDGLRMAAVLLFAFATLRHLFTGTILVGGELTETENIGRSVLAIGLAIGFLLWGIRKGLRDWRLASLALMLGAAGKVFLFDASGLEGLLRIGSFLALGFSLIGIGWLYSRYRH